MQITNKNRDSLKNKITTVGNFDLYSLFLEKIEMMDEMRNIWKVVKYEIVILFIYLYRR